MNYRIALVNDNPEILTQLTNELGHFDGLEIVFTARNGLDYLQKMKYMDAEKHPQVVLMDIEMPMMGGIEAIEKSNRLYKDKQFVMLASSNDDHKLYEALKGGADCYVLKDEQPEIIFNTIKATAENNHGEYAAG
jgi:DNA-binding NarL/FixJ family response regulator